MSIHRDYFSRVLIQPDQRGVCLLNVCVLVIAVLLLCFAHQVAAQCVMEISDTPMDTKVVVAPPNIMFVLDDSGSMDWEYMVQGADNGKFEDNIEYLFDDPGDNVYGTGSSNGTILSGSNRGKWKAQWSGYNRLYFNPQADFAPWPGMPNADTTNPRSNPNNATPTFDLTAEYYSITEEVIVDDQDPEFSKTGTWAGFSHSEAYSDYYYHTNASGQNVTATWTPDLRSAEYEVYAMWRAIANRAQAVPYTIAHAGGSSVVNKNQRLNSGTWNLLGTYQFNQGQGASSVSISYYVVNDAGVEPYDRVCADAIKFASTAASDISIKNAHYYTWDDVDADGELDAGEGVYLVNFVAGVREYYLVDDKDGDDNVESGELETVQPNQVPDSVKAANYDEDGGFISYKTDAEDLQNFANWYSFYRRRELAAKAAVAHSISGLVGVRVGFYSINSTTTTGLRQQVLPVKLNVPDVAGAAEVIVDNRDSGYTESGGNWYESGASNEYNNSSRYTRYSGRSAKWTPNLPETNTYNVYAWWDYYSTRDTNALYTVSHNAGTWTDRRNQKENYSQWALLGTFDFDAGTSGWVSVTRDNSSTGSSTSADAVKFECTGTSTGGTVFVDSTDDLLTALYGLNSSGSTPLRNGLKKVGQYYHKYDGSWGDIGPSPYASAEEGGACQHAFAIVMTDGYWNGSSPSIGNQDLSEGSPYADAYSDTLADVAMKYYKEDLANTLDDVVATNSCDKAAHQHMVTYAVSFGVTGSLDHEDYHPCLLDGGTPPWPNPTTSDLHKIDDMWHAAINGRGLFFSAADPEELVDSLMAVMQNIASRMASGASVTVNGEELGTNTVLYQSSYMSDGWIGDVTAYPIDYETGEILREADDILWRASDKLQDIAPNDRNIVTYTCDATACEAMPFRFIDLSDEQKTALDADWGTDPTTAENMVDYLRGSEIDGFRPRIKKLGDIVHSAPLLVDNTIFAAANDGMMHAFNAETGEERFAYIPSLVFDNLKALANNEYEHKFYVDMTPYARKGVKIGTSEGRTMLIGGLAKGGKGYYALDVTNADSVNTDTAETQVDDMVLWEYPSPGTDEYDIGYSYSQAFITQSNDPNYEWVIVFGNGYESFEGEAVLYVLDLSGNVLKQIYTGVTGCNGLSSPTLPDVNGDYKADYAYAGDLKGNLWKFDLTSSNHEDWDVAYKVTEEGVDVPKPLFKAVGQPITTKPSVMRHCSRHGYIVVFGTGIYLSDGDRADTSTQTIYGIWDYGDDTDDSEFVGQLDRAGETETFTPQPPTLTTVTLLEQSVVDDRTLYDHRLRTLSDHEPQWETEDDSIEGELPDPSSSASNHVGWYFDLPDAGERVVRDLMIRDGKVIVISVTPNDSPCAGGGDSIVHEIDACTGGRLDHAHMDINNDGVIDDDDLIEITDPEDPTQTIQVPPTGMSFSGMLYPPVVVRMPDGEREMTIFSTSAGNTVTIFQTAGQRGVFYWREIFVDDNAAGGQFLMY